jgi:hypothetical protein
MQPPGIRGVVRPPAARPAAGRGQGAARRLRVSRSQAPGGRTPAGAYRPRVSADGRPQRMACEVVSHASIGLRLPKPAIHQPRPASGVWPSSRSQASGMRSAAAWPASRQPGLPAPSRPAASSCPAGRQVALEHLTGADKPGHAPRIVGRPRECGAMAALAQRHIIHAKAPQQLGGKVAEAVDLTPRATARSCT